jgi:hypothetical protein
MIRLPTMLFAKNKVDNEKKEKKTYKYTIVQRTFFSLNEIHVSTFILTVKGYADYFNPILSYDEVVLTESSLINSHLSIKKRDNDYPSFFTVFYNPDSSLSKKQYIFNVISCFKHLLNTVSILNTLSLVSIDFHPKNIVIDKRGNPIYSNLDHVFHYPTLTNERKRSLFSSGTNIFMPIEAHVICYLYEHKSSSISVSDLEEILDSYCGGLGSLSLFEKEYISYLKTGYFSSMKKFINVAAEKVVYELMKTTKSWNIYGLSMMFLIFLRDRLNIREVLLSPKNGFLFEFSHVLIRNLEKGYTVEKTILLVDDIVYSIPLEDWDTLINDDV